MKNKVAIVLPYFGSLPSYFPLFLRSVELNPDFDVLFVTDINLSGVHVPDNVQVIRLSFDDVRSRVATRVPVPFKLDTPYKLCDCRPLYGILFEDELKGYDFWGHCDADMLLGDLSRFITDEILDAHDKLFTHGHFVIYRNDKIINQLAITYHDAPCGLDFAGSSRLSCYFDEVGMANIAKLANLRIYQNPAFADITPKHDALTLAPICKDKNIPNQRFFWRNGQVVRTAKGSDEITQFMYIHLQKRDMDVFVDKNDSAWEIYPHAFYAEGSAPVGSSHSLRMRFKQEVGFQISRIRRLSPERMRLSFAIKALRASL